MLTSAAAFALAAIVPSVLGRVYHHVQVGPNGQNVYDPPYVHARAHDVVAFSFNPKNHTVTASLFDPPCVKLNGGFTTGFVPVAANAHPIVKEFHLPPHYGGEPIWFYCGQGNHCGQGMVFAINPPPAHSERSFEAHKALAIARNGTAAPAPSAVSSAVHAVPTKEVYGEDGEDDKDDVSDGAQKPIAWHTATVTWGGAGAASPTASAEDADYTIVVGPDGQLMYSPAEIKADVGKTVLFEFRQKNHTVTQSSFKDPCTGLIKADGTPGFKSGFKPVAAGVTEGFPTVKITINDTEPFWGYCGQTGHCAAGMVFSINAPEEGNTHEKFVQNAIATSSGSRRHKHHKG